MSSNYLIMGHFYLKCLKMTKKESVFGTWAVYFRCIFFNFHLFRVIKKAKYPGTVPRSIYDGFVLIY